MTKYPNIERLGIEVVELFPTPYGVHSYIAADDLEKLLADAPRVRGCGGKQTWSPPEDVYFWGLAGNRNDGVEAILIGEQPIKQESEERRVLRKFTDYYESVRPSPPLDEILGEAKAILEKEQ